MQAGRHEPDGRLVAAARGWYRWQQQPVLAAAVLVRFRTTSGGRVVLDGLLIDGPPSAALLRAISLGRIEAAANARPAGVRVPVPPASATRGRPAPEGVNGPSAAPSNDAGRPAPPGAGRRRGRPDTFYQDLADAYRSAAQRSPRPAVDLAVQHDIPVTTAHRWIREARRRGFLPPGRPGASG